MGFVGGPENLSAIAEIATDYPEIPVVAYMPDLSWWHDDLIDQYQDAFLELLLPQTSVLVGNHSTLWRWLLPDWSSERALRRATWPVAVADSGVPYLLVTGIPAAEQHIENTLTSAQTVLGSGRSSVRGHLRRRRRHLSATLAALVASGSDLPGLRRSLTYLDGCLDHGFARHGPCAADRMFWAESDDDDNDDSPFRRYGTFDLPP